MAHYNITKLVLRVFIAPYLLSVSLTLEDVVIHAGVDVRVLSPHRGGGQRGIGPPVPRAAVGGGEQRRAGENNRPAPTRRHLGLLVPGDGDGPNGAGDGTGRPAEDQRGRSFHM